jgi:hypothetical protein
MTDNALTTSRMQLDILLSTKYTRTTFARRIIFLRYCCYEGHFWSLGVFGCSHGLHAFFSTSQKHP